MKAAVYYGPEDLHIEEVPDAVQEAFDIWREESGRPYCQISRILACSVP